MEPEPQREPQPGPGAAQAEPQNQPGPGAAQGEPRSPQDQPGPGAAQGEPRSPQDQPGPGAAQAEPLRALPEPPESSYSAASEVELGRCPQLQGPLPRPFLQADKGSLDLRSNHLYYSKATLVNRWDENRQADPKDYDIAETPIGKKDLRKSAYRRFGDAIEEDWKTTTIEQLSQLNLKKDYEERELPKFLVNADNIDAAINKRDTGHPERGYGAVCPRHPPDHGKMYLKTTYNDEFIPPYPYIPSSLHQDSPTLSAVYKKCHSQFTDTADYRRPGMNTWQDESGWYANRELKQSIFKITNPITPSI